MATGYQTQVAKQQGEYLVAAELCRRGFIATTFTGNVPHFDIIACNSTGGHQAIQVKATLRDSWQFDIRDFVDVQLDGNRQIMGRPTKAPFPNLTCVFVRLRSYGTDEFFIMTWEDLQKVAIAHHRKYLARHGGIRPKKPKSFHTTVDLEEVTEIRDKWGVLGSRLQDDL
jgi:hypothetical protein